MNLHATGARPGLTLLEVVVSVAIFGISIVAIFQLVNLGNDRAEDVRLQTRTSLLCQAKLAEMSVDSTLLSSSESYTAFDGPDKDLSWKSDVQPYPDSNSKTLFLVKVWVKADVPGGKTVESHLGQIVLNPANRGTTFDVIKEPAAATPAPTPTGGS